MSFGLGSGGGRPAMIAEFPLTNRQAFAAIFSLSLAGLCLGLGSGGGRPAMIAEFPLTNRQAFAAIYIPR